MIDEDLLDLVALIEERCWIGIGEQRGAVEQLAESNDGLHG